ncbi:MAG: LysR family transcriptional regulator [Maritimibacter sp.]
MDWSRLPSLASLRAFETLARHGSLSAAARELNVTHAAISQHLRKLEDHFSEPLAQRVGHSMVLTQTGTELAHSLSEGFGQIGDVITSLMDATAQRPVRVTLTPTFAETWLMPRVGAFWTAHPDIELNLNPSPGLVDLRRENYDMGIRFGRGSWPGVESEPLIMSGYVVVAAPDFTTATSLSELGDLTKLPWFHSPGSKEHRIWGETLGLDFDALGMRAMPTHNMVISAVRAGLGLAIEARTLVDADIASKQLVVLHEGDSEGLGYHIIQRPGAVLSPGARTFRTWLKRAAQAQD